MRIHARFPAIYHNTPSEEEATEAMRIHKGFLQSIVLHHLKKLGISTQAMRIHKNFLQSIILHHLKKLPKL